jgi:hypothetical protein
MAKILLGIALVVLVVGHLAWYAIAGAVVITGLAYAWSIWRNPYRRCILCKGGKHNNDSTFHGARGNCWVCRGRGQYARWGVRLFMRGTAAQIRQHEHGRNY